MLGATRAGLAPKRGGDLLVQQIDCRDLIRRAAHNRLAVRTRSRIRRRTACWVTPSVLAACSS